MLLYTTTALVCVWVILIELVTIPSKRSYSPARSNRSTCRRKTWCNLCSTSLRSVAHSPPTRTEIRPLHSPQAPTADSSFIESHTKGSRGAGWGVIARETSGGGDHTFQTPLEQQCRGTSFAPINNEMLHPFFGATRGLRKGTARNVA